MTKRNTRQALCATLDYILFIHEPGDVGGFRVKTLRGLDVLGANDTPFSPGEHADLADEG